jgi:hypothetical protein
MAKRARKSQTSNAWMIALTVLAALFLVWWLSARRAETPGLPASQPGARALSAPPDSPEHAHDEITGEEKADLERIIHNGGAPKGGAAQNGGDSGAKAPGE